MNYLVINLEHVSEAYAFANLTMFVFTSISVPDDDKTLPVTARPYLEKRMKEKGMISS